MSGVLAQRVLRRVWKNSHSEDVMTNYEDTQNRSLDLSVPPLTAFAAPQLTEFYHRHIARVVSASGTEDARTSAANTVRQAAEDGRLSASDVDRLMKLVTTDNANVHQLYLESLDDPRASDLAGALLGVIQSRKTPATDEPHTHVLTDGDLIVLGIAGGPIMALGVAMALAYEHVTITID
jgi:hypothetical protein